MSTIPDKLVGQQKIFYTLSGKGTVTAGGKTAKLRKGVGFMIPAELEFFCRKKFEHLYSAVYYVCLKPIDHIIRRLSGQQCEQNFISSRLCWT